MKLIDSDALGVVTKALGLTGRGSQQTELTDGIVDQALDVAPLVRRGRTIAGSEGVSIFRIQNLHGGANNISTAVNPFLLPAAGVIAPFPSPIPPQFDLWVLSATIRQISGAGTLTASLAINYPADALSLSINNGGAGVAIGITSHTVAYWDALVTEDIEFALLNGARGPNARLGIRLPRSTLTQLVFSSTSSAAAVFDMYIMVGLFPVALGQDGIV